MLIYYTGGNSLFTNLWLTGHKKTDCLSVYTEIYQDRVKGEVKKKNEGHESLLPAI